MSGEATLAPSEELRRKLLEEERRLRAKQPEHWAKTKYRKYALMQERREREAKKAAAGAEDKKTAKKKGDGGESECQPRKRQGRRRQRRPAKK